MSETMWHVNAEGRVLECGAWILDCPVGDKGGLDKHFSTKEEAISASEQFMESQYGAIASVRKPQSLEQSFDSGIAAEHYAHDMLGNPEFPTMAAYSRFKELAVREENGQYVTTKDNAKLEAYAMQAAREFPGRQNADQAPARRLEKSFDSSIAAQHHAHDMLGNPEFPTMAAYSRFTELAVREENGQYVTTEDNTQLESYAMQAALEFPKHERRSPTTEQFTDPKEARTYARNLTSGKLGSLGAESEFAKNAVFEGDDGKYHVITDPQTIRGLVRDANVKTNSVRENSVKMDHIQYDTVARNAGEPVLSNVTSDNYKISGYGNLYRDSSYKHFHPSVPQDVLENAKSVVSNTQGYYRGEGYTNTETLRSSYMVVNVNAKGEPGKGNSYAVYHAYGAGSPYAPKKPTDHYEQVEFVQGGNKAARLEAAEHLAKRLHTKEKNSGSIGDVNEGEFWDKYKDGHIVHKTKYGYTMDRPQIADDY